MQSLCKLDLLKYSKAQLALIAKHNGLSQTGSKDQLADRISKVLIYQKAHLLSYDQSAVENFLNEYIDTNPIKSINQILNLVEGNYILDDDNKDHVKTFIKNKYIQILQNAIDSNDVVKINEFEIWARRETFGRMIMLINRYRQSQRPQVLDEADEVPDEAKICNNPIDLITTDKWSSDYLPDIKLRLIDTPERTVCFDKTGFLRYILDPANQRAPWIPNNIRRSANELNDDGYMPMGAGGAGPSRATLIHKLPDNTYILTLEYLNSLKNVKGVPIARNLRIGNLEGTYGVSQTHGQAPGETIYFVMDEDKDTLETLKGYLQILVNDRQLFFSRLELDGITTDKIIELMDETEVEPILEMFRKIFKICPGSDSDYECTRVNPIISRQPAQSPTEINDTQPDITSVLNLEDDIESEFEEALMNGDNDRINELINAFGDRILVLDINNTDISDISPLSRLPNLETFYANSTRITDFSPLSELDNLFELSITENEIEDISFLTGLNIELLDLSANDITDISPLSSLNNLQTLDLSLTSVNDISPLSSLTELKELDLSSTEVDDISPLSGLNNLEFLNIRNTGVTDISPLSGLSNLRILTITNTDIQDLSPLRGIPNLQINRN